MPGSRFEELADGNARIKTTRHTHLDDGFPVGQEYRFYDLYEFSLFSDSIENCANELVSVAKTTYKTAMEWGEVVTSMGYQVEELKQKAVSSQTNIVDAWLIRQEIAVLERAIGQLPAPAS